MIDMNRQERKMQKKIPPTIIKAPNKRIIKAKCRDKMRRDIYQSGMRGKEREQNDDRERKKMKKAKWQGNGNREKQILPSC